MPFPCLTPGRCTRVHALIIVLAVLTSPALFAQDLTTPLLTDSWQATFSNPALYGTQRGAFTIGLPGVHNDFAAENVTFNQLIERTDDQNVIDLNRVVDLLADRNEVGNDLAVETLGFGLRGDRLSFGLSHRILASGQADYPRQLLQLVAEGNEQFIGQTVEIAPFGFATSYHEFAFGASYAVDDRILIGARLKYLNGIADFRVSNGASLRLTTAEENFALTLDQNLTVNSSGTLEYEGLEDAGFNFDFEQLTFDGLFGDNRGLALDLGIFVDLDRVRLQAAANNLAGSIGWENRVENLSFTGSSSFSGLDIFDRVLEEDFSISEAVDSLTAAFSPTNDAEPYRSPVTKTYLVGGEIDLTEHLTAGLLLSHFDRSLRSETALAVNARYRFGRSLSLGLSYNARRQQAANLGAQLYATLGPVQFLAATDNLLTVFNQRDNTRSSLRVGAALAFGYRVKERTGQEAGAE